MTSDLGRVAFDHVLAGIAASPWRDALVLRGSAAMPAWVGDRARLPGDIDFVVTPSADGAIQLPVVDLLRHLDGRPPHPRLRLDIGNASLDRFSDLDADVYTGESGIRVRIAWEAADRPDDEGILQIDFAADESMPEPPVLAPVPSLAGGAPIELPAAGPGLSLAWKLRWLDADQEDDGLAQAKDLYDAVVLAEAHPNCLTPALVAAVLPRRFAADQIPAWDVAWRRLRDLGGRPIAGDADAWLARLHRTMPDDL
ncbi:MAG: nucleotidyl transferase AbiEii/AbiGii toxin family protein [Streptomycetaceae bacterium]|nr:nucleotidyl transferase AbiEii/AbiGii toxin family protein [Streptomycetaceae bacterium]NUS55014.1 nucleotidyl transferase AbiEii/AbiGii toxin family protein [Streptomycetaceae bacterium]